METKDLNQIALNILQRAKDGNYLSFFNSNLFSKDYKCETITKPYLKFFKTRYDEITISNELANQIINRATLNRYLEVFDLYINHNDKKTSLMKEVKIALNLKNTILNINECYKNMLDTPELDKNVANYTKFVTSNVKYSIKEDEYGFISTNVKDMPKLDKATVLNLYALDTYFKNQLEKIENKNK
jgi:hypothetical protein